MEEFTNYHLINPPSQSWKCRLSEYISKTQDNLPNCLIMNEEFAKCVVYKFNEINIRRHTISVESNNDEILMTCQTKEFTIGFNAVMIIKINLKTKKISRTSQLLKHGKVYKVKSLQLCLLLSKLFIKQNSGFKVGGMCVNIGSREIQYQNIPAQLFENGELISEKSFLQLITSHAQITFNTVRFIFLKLLMLLDELPLEGYPVLQDYYNSQGPIKLLNEKIFLEYRQSKKLLLEYNKKIDDPDLLKHLTPPQFNQAVPQKLCNPIKIITPIDFRQLESFNSGGYGEVYKVELQYNLAQDPGKNYKKCFAVKRPRESFRSLEHEISILKYLSEKEDEKQKRNPFLAQTYCSSELQDCLLMEFYQNFSLEHYKKKFHLTLSLHTKLYLLYSIALGLNMLYEAGVVHLDIKPQNILIARNCVPKISDFGEAQIFSEEGRGPKVGDQKHYPGRTHPFSAPEYKKGKAAFKPPYDVYSFGVLMSELLHDEYPFNFNPANVNKYQQLLENQELAMRFDTNNTAGLGQSNIINMLILAQARCLSFTPQQRPTIQWIIIFLKTVLNLVDKLY